MTKKLLLINKYTEHILFLKKLTIRKIYNFLLLKISFYVSVVLKRPVIIGKPEALSIEPINKCNLSCIECPTGTDELKRPKTEISYDNYINVIDNTYKYLNYLILYFQGEPFLSKNIFKMISYANKKNIFTYVSTNGHFLSTDNCKKIINSGLDKITISLDGTTQETYEKYRKNGEIEKVLKGIENLVKTKKDMNSLRPFIEIQFLVFKHNQHEIPEIKKLYKQLGVNKLSLKSAQFYHKENYKLLTNIDKYARYKLENGELKLKKKLRNRCWRMWHSLVVTSLGDIAPCCFDKDAYYSFANVSDVNITEIRSNVNYKNFASTILNNRGSIDICRNCNE